MSHALECAESCYRHNKHNENCDTFSDLMKPVCCNVRTEPSRQVLHSETFKKIAPTEDDARLDIKDHGWSVSKLNKFVEMKVFGLRQKSGINILFTSKVQAAFRKS